MKVKMWNERKNFIRNETFIVTTSNMKEKHRENEFIDKIESDPGLLVAKNKKRNSDSCH